MDDSKLISSIASSLQKKLGKEVTVGTMNDDFDAEPKLFIPSSSTLLNRAIGGGAAVGRITEIAGDVQVGKSLLLLDFLAHAQKLGAFVSYLDSEFATSKRFALELCGIDLGSILHIETKYQEAFWQAVDDTLTLVRKADENRPIVIGGDSMAALSAKATKDLTFEQRAQVALETRIIGDAMRRLNPDFATKNAAFIFTNQIRSKIGAMPFEEKTESFGGYSLRFFASTRLKLSSVSREKNDGGDITAVNCRVTVKKNRFDPPGRVIQYPINVRGPHRGIDDHASLVNFLYERGVLGATKGWVEFEGTRFRRTELIQRSRDDNTVYEAIKTKALEIFDTSVETDYDDGE